MTTKIQPYQHKSGFTAIGTTLSTVGHEVILVNPDNRDYTRDRGDDTRGSCFVLWFGACAPTYLMVWDDHLEAALDTAVDWIVEYAPGLIADDQVHEAYNDAIADGKSEEEAIEEAELDTTCAGNCGNYLLSWEWGIALDSPTRQDLLTFIGAK